MPGTYIPSEYLPILIALMAATAIVVGGLLFGSILRPRRPYPEKLLPYESGNPPVGEPRERFSIKFYVIAMLFVVFDVEAAFLYSWAVAYGNIGLYGFWGMVIFIVIIFIGYAYDWKIGALDWKDANEDKDKDKDTKEG